MTEIIQICTVVK